MGKIETLKFNDETGVLQNLTDAINEFRGHNLKAIGIVYKRKDGSCRTFRSGFDRYELIGIFEQMKFDVLEDMDAFVRDYDKPLSEDE